jgi:hypothetical protein
LLEAPEIFVIRIGFDCASQWLRELPSLNRRGIKLLRGRAWNASTIHGSAKRPPSAHRAGGALAGNDLRPRQGEKRELRLEGRAASSLRLERGFDRHWLHLLQQLPGKDGVLVTSALRA